MIEKIKKIIIGLIAISLFIGCLAITLNHLNPKSDPNPLENIEKKLDEAAQKESVLTENEKMLEQESTEKEWQEVDNTTDKQYYDNY